ncbi:MarR family winged helix-turn-helix transcriptional regulator [Lachnotalea sp. AF33-28]|uniref:MarR family winged helix-turn-helix transcriptional regulator n=1 Tax=Lachnotalea sp. AF33-28 TaxID=2292046 RepID=UPI000E52320F|nr:MarR family transcriptional regulator [Lachnotalea sp. AF33-28]RHP32679.1 MarR family transcriptional regulator [Lachnotalea sp. AF33-28]
MIKEKSEIREMLLRLESSRRRILQPQFTALGLSLGQGQARILNTLLTQDHITQKELADRCRLDVTTMSRTIDKMEEAGLLNRLRRPDCRRSFLIELTEAGRTKAQEVHACFSSLDECIWQGFDRQEMETLLEILKKININLEERQQ